MSTNQGPEDQGGETIDSRLDGTAPATWVEPRCRVCRNEAIREKVNHMLVMGSTYASIARSLESLGAESESGGPITADSIARHSRRHFPVQNAAHATYRQIIEKRAADQKVDFANGVATALTPIAVLEVMMHKGFESLMDPNTTVTPAEGARAAEKLLDYLGTTDKDAKLTEIIVQFDQLIRAVKTHVDPEIWPLILDEINSGIEPEDHVKDPDLDAVDDDDASRQ